MKRRGPSKRCSLWDSSRTLRSIRGNLRIRLTRARWREESALQVLSFWDPEHRWPTVDLFAEYPMDFDTLYRGSQLMPLSGTAVRIANVDHLIALKRAAGRPKDVEDAARLASLRGGSET